MQKFTKIVYFTLFTCLGVTTLFSTAWAVGEDEPFPYDIVSDTPVDSGGNNPIDLAQVIQDDALSPSNGIMTRLTNFFRVSGTSYNPDNEGDPAINYVKWIMNLLLGLVSLIALVLIIFAFYLIFFGKEEEQVKKAKKILTGVAIALAIMALSWIIVSFLFSSFNYTTGVPPLP